MMKLTQTIDPSRNLPFDEWIDRLEDIAEDNGFFEPLGPKHSATFIEGSPSLLVTFETVDSARGRSENDVPLGWTFAESEGWSQLCLLSHGTTWFRHLAVFSFFDKLVDEGFFDEYDRVVFYGVGPCGYAAATFSVTAPGAVVVAASPQATLDPAVAGWDSRFKKARRIAFNGRYGFAPEMLEGAERAFIVFDPEIRNDAAHAGIFKRPHVELVPMRFLGKNCEDFLLGMGQLPGLLQRAMEGTLGRRDFFRAYRERHTYLPYLRAALGRLLQEDRHYLTALFCRSVLTRINAPRFSNQLNASLVQLEREGKSLPKAREIRKRA